MMVYYVAIKQCSCMKLHIVWKTECIIMLNVWAPVFSVLIPVIRYNT